MAHHLNVPVTSDLKKKKKKKQGKKDSQQVQNFLEKRDKIHYD